MMILYSLLVILYSVIILWPFAILEFFTGDTFVSERADFLSLTIPNAYGFIFVLIFYVFFGYFIRWMMRRSASRTSVISRIIAVFTELPAYMKALLIFLFLFAVIVLFPQIFGWTPVGEKGHDWFADPSKIE